MLRHVRSCRDMFRHALFFYRNNVTYQGYHSGIGNYIGVSWWVICRRHAFNHAWTFFVRLKVCPAMPWHDKADIFVQVIRTQLSTMTDVIAGKRGNAFMNLQPVQIRIYITHLHRNIYRFFFKKFDNIATQNTMPCISYVRCWAYPRNWGGHWMSLQEIYGRIFSKRHPSSDSVSVFVWRYINQLIN